MLGRTITQYLAKLGKYELAVTCRNKKEQLPRNVYVYDDIHLENIDNISSVIHKFQPQQIINCIGVIKQKEKDFDDLSIFKINTELPRKLSMIADIIGARLIHYSTDCVFSGNIGGYTENDFPDANDVYGLSKFFGEVVHSPHLTVRTSIIGHEISSSYSLLNWFLSQTKFVNGYGAAIFSGLPTVIHAEILDKFILDSSLTGLYHVASDKISKLDLLSIISQEYSHDIEIIPDYNVKIDRSLSCKRFSLKTGFAADTWPNMIKKMREFENV